MIDPLQFRELSIGDIDAIVRIEHSSFETPWSRRQFEDEFNNRDLTLPVGAECNGRLIAYAFLWIILDECHLANIAVDPEWRRKGIGRALMGRTIEIARERNCVKMMLEVRKSNRSAIALYEQSGFHKVGIRKHYYRDGFLRTEDAVLMNLDLSAGAR